MITTRQTMILIHGKTCGLSVTFFLHRIGLDLKNGHHRIGLSSALTLFFLKENQQVFSESCPFDLVSVLFFRPQQDVQMLTHLSSCPLLLAVDSGMKPRNS